MTNRLKFLRERLVIFGMRQFKNNKPKGVKGVKKNNPEYD